MTSSPLPAKAWVSRSNFAQRRRPNSLRENEQFDGKWPMICIFVISLIWALLTASVGWNHTLSDMHGFRQTKTAITSYYFMQGGPFLGYETPVLGAPLEHSLRVSALSMDRRGDGRVIPHRARTDRTLCQGSFLWSFFSDGMGAFVRVWPQEALSPGLSRCSQQI